MWTFPTVLFNVNEKNETVPAESLIDRIIAAAKAIVGQKEEHNNSGFVDPLFEQRLEQVGWHKFQAWCAYTAELVWKTGFGKEHALYPLLDKLFSGMAVASWRNFKASSFRTGNIPKVGALVFWQHGTTSQGHAGVVIQVLPDGRFISVEGNTNMEGGREGIEVGQMTRRTVVPFSNKGLNLLGFVYAPE